MLFVMLAQGLIILNLNGDKSHVQKLEGTFRIKHDFIILTRKSFMKQCRKNKDEPCLIRLFL